MDQVSKIRQVDIVFNSNERLWRRIEFEQVKQNKLKGGAFRLQVSVIRENYNREKNIAPNGKWNGLAETTAGEISGLIEEQINIICVDSPTEKDAAHALIAATIDLDTCISSETTRNIVRARLVQKFRIDIRPTKIE